MTARFVNEIVVRFEPRRLRTAETSMIITPAWDGLLPGKDGAPAQVKAMYIHQGRALGAEATIWALQPCGMTGLCRLGAGGAYQGDSDALPRHNDDVVAAHIVRRASPSG